ncbi:MAG: MFS transporter, partial [Infirmifilum sp.]
MNQEEKFSYFKVFLLGFGFFGISVIWSIYNSYLPIFLKELGLASWIVGFIMTIDNIFAVILLPYLGVLSDVTRTRIGRRKPYILLGAPPAALTFALIPFFKGELIPLMIVVVTM